MDDGALMVRVRGGDDAAFEVLVDRYRDPLVNYLTHLTGSRERAEEFAQEAFYRLYRHAARYDERERLAPYLFRIATNLVRSEYRRARRWKLLLPWLGEETHAAAPAAPGRTLMESEIQRQVRAALGSLPETYRAPLVLREIEGWSYQEIAAALGCREGTIKSRINRGRERLRQLLAPYWNGGTDEFRSTGAAAPLVAERESF